MRSPLIRRLALGLLVALLNACGTTGDDVSTPQEPSALTPSETGSEGPEWTPLFDGETLAGWRASGYPNEGSSYVEDGVIVLEAGELVTGITWTGEFPTSRYEIALEARRISGADFFCGLTFPFGDSHASLIVGGWGGEVCGISSLDGHDAGSTDNPTHSWRSFDSDRWYAIRLRVSDQRIEAWIDDEPIVDVDTAGRQVAPRGDVSPSLPLGLASFQTTANLRDIRWRAIANTTVAN